MKTFQNKFVFFVFFLAFFQFVVSDKAEIQTQEDQETQETFENQENQEDETSEENEENEENEEEVLTLENLLDNSTDDNLLKYHGGPVLDFAISLHYIWYGKWSAKDQEVSVAEFVGNNIATSDWYRVTVCYTDAAGNSVTDTIKVGSETFMNSKTFGSQIDQSQYEQIIQQAISKNGVGQSPDDIYVVWLHDEINAPSLCDDTCGFHSYYNSSAGSLKYMVIGTGGNALNCDGCASNNGPYSSVINQMINSFAHQLIETVSNPIPWTGYYDPLNRENGAKCANNFIRRTTFRSDPNREWNVVIGIEDPHWFLIQANWDIVSQSCVLYPTKKNCFLYGGSKPITSAIHDPSASSGMVNHVTVYQLLTILLVSIVNILLF